MKLHDQKFDTKQQALDYKREHQLHQRTAPASPGAIGANVSKLWVEVLPVDTLIHPADSPAARQVIQELLAAEQRISTLTIDALERIRDRCAELLQTEEA